MLISTHPALVSLGGACPPCHPHTTLQDAGLLSVLHHSGASPVQKRRALRRLTMMMGHVLPSVDPPPLRQFQGAAPALGLPW